MTSLTPLSEKERVTKNAFEEGLLNGLFTMIPAAGIVFALTKQSPAFRLRTNVQARTAMVVMPGLFMFAITAEDKIVHDMKNMAREAQHAHDSVNWAENQLTATYEDQQQAAELSDLYKRAVYESGVRVVPGDSLSMQHIAANYVAENPFKVLASLAVPGVAWIFYGRSGQEHLTFGMKVMHTRVFGQFATISALLGVMGFKELMDRNGKYITEAEADARVEEMKQLRLSMMARLEANNRAQESYRKEIQKAHDQDVQEGHVHSKKNQHHKKTAPAAAAAAAAENQTEEGSTMAVSPKLDE